MMKIIIRVTDARLAVDTYWPSEKSGRNELLHFEGIR
jgi:hypothetical protein